MRKKKKYYNVADEIKGDNELAIAFRGYKNSKNKKTKKRYLRDLGDL